MSTRYQKPEFEVLNVGAECTAYSGAEPRATRPGPGLRADDAPASADRGDRAGVGVGAGTTGARRAS